MTTTKSKSKSGAFMLGIIAGAALVLTGMALAGPAKAEAKGNAPAMWVLKDKDSTVYLFGTMHLIKKDTVWRTPTMDNAFKASKDVWFEATDVNDQAKAQAAVMKYGLSMDKPLSSRLSAEELKAFRDLVAEYKLPAAQLEPMRPWLVGFQISLLPIKKAGYDPNSGSDMVLLLEAKAAKKSLVSLEGIDMQFSLFGNMPEAEELKFFNHSISGAARDILEVDQLAENWRTGNVDVLAFGAEEVKTKGSQYIYDMLLTKRNTAWADAIAKRMKGKGTTFVAVGALHLVGPDSVQAILAKRGIKAKRVQ